MDMDRKNVGINAADSPVMTHGKQHVTLKIVLSSQNVLPLTVA